MGVELNSTNRYAPATTDWPSAVVLTKVHPAGSVSVTPQPGEVAKSELGVRVTVTNAPGVVVVGMDLITDPAASAAGAATIASAITSSRDTGKMLYLVLLIFLLSVPRFTFCWNYTYVNWSAGEVADVALAVTTVTSTVPVPAGLVTVIEL